MGILTPDYWFYRITDIPAEFFLSRGIRLLALDVDNTLTTYNNPTPAPGVPEWLESMQKAGLTLVILSNNNRPRVAPFAEKLGLPFAANAAKPLPFLLAADCRKRGVRAKECALIGDQLFTDILCGNLLPGVLSVLVTLQEPENTALYRFKRRLEKPILRRFARRHPEVLLGDPAREVCS